MASVNILDVQRSGLIDTHAGMIRLYTAINMSPAVWLLKGVMEETLIEYEEAAPVDEYTHFRTFYKGILLQIMTGIASTATLCLILHIKTIH